LNPRTKTRVYNGMKKGKKQLKKEKGSLSGGGKGDRLAAKRTPLQGYGKEDKSGFRRRDSSLQKRIKKRRGVVRFRDFIA